MYRPSKPNYLAFALTLGVLIFLVVLIIPMRPSNLEYLASQEPKDTITTVVEDTTAVEPILELDTIEKIDSTTVVIPTIDSLDIDTAVAPVVVVPKEIKPIETPPKTENKTTTAPKEEAKIEPALGSILLTIFMVLILAYAVFRIITKRWEYQEEQKLMAQMKLDSPMQTASYDPSDWGFDFANAHNASDNEPILTNRVSDEKTKKTKENTPPKDKELEAKKIAKSSVNTAATTNLIASTSPKRMPLWLKDLLFSPFIIAFSIVLGVLAGLFRLLSLFANREATKLSVAKITKYIDLYAIDIPSTLTLVLFAWVQYLMFPAFPFHSDVLSGLILLPIVYLPLYTLPAFYRIWKREEGDLGMWATAILWNLGLAITLLIYGLMQMMEGQESGGDNTNLYIGLGALAVLLYGSRVLKIKSSPLGMWATVILCNLVFAMTFLINTLVQMTEGQESGRDSTNLYIGLGVFWVFFVGKSWYKDRQGKSEDNGETIEEETGLTVVEIKEGVAESIEEENLVEPSNIIKPKKTASPIKWILGIGLGAAALVFLFDENLFGLDEELNSGLQGGLLILIVMIIAFFASNGNKKRTNLAVALEEEDIDVDINKEEEKTTASEKIKTLQQIDPALFLEPEWWLNVDLSRLGMIDMSNQNLDENHPFMPYLMDCVNLKTLYLNDNNFEEIPFEVFELVQLKVLELKNNNIPEIHSDIEFMEGLNILDLSNNELIDLPKELTELTTLKLLAINDNPITKTAIDAFQATCPKLVIEHNAEIKEELDELSQEEQISTKDLIKIKRLLKKKLKNPSRVTYVSELFQQDLTTLPLDILKEFSNLSGIYLVGNQFTEIPSALYQLPNLKNVYLGDNQITEIPDQITEIKELKTLSLSNNPLAKVSMNITKLPKLRQLYLDYTQLKSFPMWVTQIPTLKELSLYGNHIKKLPEEITKLKQLEDLDLGFANMLEIPDFLCTMDSIQVLNWAGNGLEQLPERFDRLLNLRELNLSHNPNLQLDEHLLKQFPYLKILHLGAMGYDLLPRFMTNLTFLDSLWLNDNKLTNLPYDFDNLTKLKTLSLSRNYFKDLPENIGNFSGLENLYLDDNQLEVLPDSMKRLTKLKKLSLKNNALSLSTKRDLQRWLPNTQIDY